MYKHILIATDGSDLANHAVTHGLDLAKYLGAEVTAVTVTEPVWATMPLEVAIAFPHEEYVKASKAVAAKILEGVSIAAANKGVKCAVKHMPNQYPSDGILQAASELACDLIVVASHGRRGLVKLLLGSQASKIAGASPIPVLIVR
jgi:nucleotide-binding universal stress UspA family protein